MNTRYLDEDGLRLVINALNEKFNTKFDTLIIKDKTSTKEIIPGDVISLDHISIEQTDNGVKLSAEPIAEYKVVPQNADDSEKFAAIYQFQKIVDGTITETTDINIPRDFFLLGVDSKTVTEQDKQEGGIFYGDDYSTYDVGDKYIDFTVGVKNGRKTMPEHLYINFTDITPALYTNGTAINIDENNHINVLYDETLTIKNNKLSVNYDDDLLYMKNNKLSIKEADAVNTKGVVNIPNTLDKTKKGYIMKINDDNKIDYTDIDELLDDITVERVDEASINALFN